MFVAKKKVTDFFVAKLEISWGPLCFFVFVYFCLSAAGIV